MMKKNILQIWMAISLLMTLGAQARQIPERDIALRSGGNTSFGHVQARIVKFGGYSTPECRLAVSRDGQNFYLTKMHSTCWKGINRNGIKIICNSNKSVCKTRSELSDFVRSGSSGGSSGGQTAPRWCRSSHLNAAERTICSHPSLGRLDQELAQVYGSAKARGGDMGQKQWLRYERNRCGTNVRCLRSAYEERIASLKQKAPSRATHRSYRAKNLIGSHRCRGVFPQAILDIQMYGSASKNKMSSIKWRGGCDRGWMHERGKLFFRPKPGSNIDYFYISGTMNHGFFQGNIQVDYIEHSRVIQKNRRRIHLSSYEDYRRYETPGGYNKDGVNPTYAEERAAGESALLGAIGYVASKVRKSLAEGGQISVDYTPCVGGDTCYEYLRRKDNGDVIMRCTKGPSTGKEKCLSYRRDTNRYASGCGFTDGAAHHYTLEKAGNLACEY